MCVRLHTRNAAQCEAANVNLKIGAFQRMRLLKYGFLGGRLVNAALISDKMKGNASAVWRSTMFANVYTLPCAKHRHAACHRYREGDAGQNRFQVSGHVVWPFVIMGVARIFGRNLV